MDNRYGTATLVAVMLLLTACGDDSLVNLGPPPPPLQSPSGIWIGPFTSETDGSVSNTLGIVSQDNDVQLVASTISSRHYAGVVSTDGSTLVGTLNVFLGRVGPFIGSGGVQSITLDGTATERNDLFGDYSGSEDSGRFNLSYLSVYDDGSSLSLTSGNWIYSEASAGGALYTVVFDIDNAGVLFGTDTAGCVYSGSVGLIDPETNGYSVTFEVTDCLLNNGNYTGLAWISSIDGGQQNRLTMGLNKPNRAFAAPFQRL